MKPRLARLHPTNLLLLGVIEGLWLRKDMSGFRGWRYLGLSLVAIALIVTLSLIQASQSIAQPSEVFLSQSEQGDRTPQTDLPDPQIHPLPPTLVEWADPSHQGDYFDEISPTPAGYLIWAQFPVTVYVEPPDSTQNAPAIAQAQVWVDRMHQAIQEWNAYLPLVTVDDPDTADIRIWRRSPPLRGLGENLRARSAETRYEFYLRQTGEASVLAQRFTIFLRPGQTADYLQAAARHELGHALGIWGHSPLETDALYFSQVRQPAPISVRDVNTLRRLYEQPTRLGWAIPVG